MVDDCLRLYHQSDLEPVLEICDSLVVLIEPVREPEDRVAFGKRAHAGDREFTRANGCAAFAQYKPAGDGTREPWALQVIETSGGRITALHHWIPPFAEQLFAQFGLPLRLEGELPYSSESANSSS